MAAFGSSNIAPSYHQAFAGAVPFAQKCQCGLALRLAHPSFEWRLQFHFLEEASLMRSNLPLFPSPTYLPTLPTLLL